MPSSPRLTGKVVRKLEDKGFGFIAGEGKEYFFHRTAVSTGWDNLQVNDDVTFTVGQGQKGPRAEDVKSEGY